jgi:hypothetical protein
MGEKSVRLTAALIACMTLAACATTPVDQGGGGNAGCDADALKYLVGQPLSEIDTDSLPYPHRVIPFGTMVTMEYVEGRYNFELDADSRVARVYCG